MVTFKYGGKNGKEYSLLDSSGIVVRTMQGSKLNETPLSSHSRKILSDFQDSFAFRCPGVEVMLPAGLDVSLRDVARASLKKEETIRFAGRLLQDPDSGSPVVYTENLFLKFHDQEKLATCRQLIAETKLTIKRKLGYAKNAFFLGAPQGTGQAIFDIANDLLNNNFVEFCHPELIREKSYKTAYQAQWHLKKTTIDGNVIDEHASVVDCWKKTRGEGITIAIIDNGIDTKHEEFASKGKIVAPFDITSKDKDPRPVGNAHHGTACAGVACGNGNFSASGVAPAASLMPIRLESDLGSQDEADAFYYAANNGADVISCSWGPTDGNWWDPEDPVHRQRVALSDSTKLSIDYALKNGRSGIGSVVVFAAGNGNESIENDGYASYDPVIAVAACNDLGKKSAYSDFGRSVWCAFPSSNGEPSLTPGIWTTDRSGRSGYNPGDKRKGDLVGNYTNSFGGTSSSAPGVAGVVALILSVNKALSPEEVKEVIKNTSDKIDSTGGRYNQSGHSTWYGYGRVNAKSAVTLAADMLKSKAVAKGGKRVKAKKKKNN